MKKSGSDFFSTADYIKTIQQETRKPEQILLEDLIKDFGNGHDSTEKNLKLISINAVNGNRYDTVMRIRSEVKADSNASTKSMTAVFISRCIKELGLQGGDNYSSLDKWIFKALHATEKDLLCNTDMFLEMGRYEKKTVNKTKIVYNNDAESYLKVLFEISTSQHDDKKTKESLSKPFGKLEVLLEMAIHREFLKQYAVLTQNPEDSLLKYDKIKVAEEKDSVFKRPYIVLPTSTIREWLWGSKNSGNIKRAEDTFLRFNRERLILSISEGKHIPEGFLKLKRYKDSIRPYEIEIINIELDTIKGKREATGYKIMMHEFFFETLIQLHQANKYKPEIFEDLRKLSEREIKLYLMLSRFEGVQQPYLVLNENTLSGLGLNPKETETRKINQAIKRSILNFNQKIKGVSMSLSKDGTKVLLNQSR